MSPRRLRSPQAAQARAVKVGKDVRFSTVPEWLLYADVSAYAVRVWAILDRHSDENRKSYPSIARVASLARASRNTVKRALEELQRIGALEIEERTDEGAQTTNLYTLRVSPGDRGGSREGRGVGHERAGGGSSRGHGTKASERKPVERKKRLADPSPPDPFTEFWKLYPNKKGKRDAERAWDKRVKAGADPAALVEAVQRFAEWVVAALRVGELEAMKFVKHPATWLNKGCDEDVLLMPGRAPAARSKVDQAIAEMGQREARRNGGTQQSTGAGRNGHGGLELGDGRRNADDLARGAGGPQQRRGG